MEWYDEETQQTCCLKVLDGHGEDTPDCGYFTTNFMFHRRQDKRFWLVAGEGEIITQIMNEDGTAAAPQVRRQITDDDPHIDVPRLMAFSFRLRKNSILAFRSNSAHVEEDFNRVASPW